MPADPTSPGLYPTIWRWHFYAGLLVAPVLVVTALSGALLIFRAELERVLYPNTLFAKPLPNRVPYERQLAAARAFAPEGTVAGCGIDADPRRATAVFLRPGGRVVYVDPYTGAALGEEADLRFFSNVLALHRRLFVGGLGNVVVELTTCWTIVLLLTGAYLWWPRRGRQLWGVWLPRLRAHPYVVLRDLHAVCGLYAGCVALIIAGTGLVYSVLWGSAYNLVARAGEGFQRPEPPRSRSPAGTDALGVDEAVAIARRNLPGASLTIFFSNDRETALVAIGSRPDDPAGQRVLALDHATGEVLDDRSVRDAGPLQWWRAWNYPLHVGSVLGTPTKVIWLMTCLALTALPVTGVWMWWQRRPPGRSGFPARPQQPVPRGIARLIAALCLLLPMFGLSVAAILLGERLLRRRAEVLVARNRAEGTATALPPPFREDSPRE
jgi:uncharacterized iron-regulated membrane protein